jgi:ATP-grasp domain
MNLLIVSNAEDASFYMICNCLLKTPPNVRWKILGNLKYHQRLISVFGIEQFIDIPISPLHYHIQEPGKPFYFLKDIPEHSVIIPTDFESLRFLSKNKYSFPGHTVCSLMEEQVLDYLRNKGNQKAIAAECDVISPKEYLYSQLKDIPASQRLVIKPKLGTGSRGVFVNQNRQDAIDYYESLTPENREEQVIQDYIIGDDYFYYAICYVGKIRISGTIKPGRIRKYLGAVFVNNPSFEKIAETIVRHYKYSGPISIDFRICQESKETYLIEINPRNGSSCYFFNAANTNWLLELANFSENPDTYNPRRHIDTKVCRIRYLEIALLHLFFKLKLYNVKVLIRTVKNKLFLIWA